MNMCLPETVATRTDLPYRLCCGMSEHVSVQDKCLYTQCVCSGCWQSGIILAGRLAERRMTHFP